MESNRKETGMGVRERPGTLPSGTKPAHGELDVLHTMVV